jgi:hypothetical protein
MRRAPRIAKARRITLPMAIHLPGMCSAHPRSESQAYRPPRPRITESWYFHIGKWPSTARTRIG